MNLDPTTLAIRAARGIVANALGMPYANCQVHLAHHPEDAIGALGEEAVAILDAMNPAWLDALIGDDLTVPMEGTTEHAEWVANSGSATAVEFTSEDRRTGQDRRVTQIDPPDHERRSGRDRRSFQEQEADALADQDAMDSIIALLPIGWNRWGTDRLKAMLTNPNLDDEAADHIRYELDLRDGGPGMGA